MLVDSVHDRSDGGLPVGLAADQVGEAESLGRGQVHDTVIENGVPHPVCFPVAELVTRAWKE
jgi:hypothetical protein